MLEEANEKFSLISSNKMLILLEEFINIVQQIIYNGVFSINFLDLMANTINLQQYGRYSRRKTFYISDFTVF